MKNHKRFIYASMFMFFTMSCSNTDKRPTDSAAMSTEQDESNEIKSTVSDIKDLVNLKIGNNFFFNDENGLYTVVHFLPEQEGATFGTMILSQMKCDFTFGYNIIGNKIDAQFIKSACGRSSSNRTFFYDKTNDYIYLDIEGQKFIFTDKP